LPGLLLPFIFGHMARRGPGDRKRRGTGPRPGATAGYDRQDSFYRRAKAEGFRSRAAYKLQEIAERHQVLARGARVLDLGCWPGGWLQVAVDRVGPAGTVVGIDLRETEPVAGARVLRGDVLDSSAIEDLREAAPGGRYDVVLADLSPQLSGVRSRDEARSAELNVMTLATAEALLAPAGALVMKVFMSGETEETLRAARRLFSSVRLTSAHASRKGSAEHYLIARDRRDPTTAA
jgi:23S rRNA (uridine2552-2'-O)-methyltransferase